MLLLFFYRTNDQTGATQICIPVNKDDLEINTMLRIEKAAADGYVGRKINDPIWNPNNFHVLLDNWKGIKFLM